MRYKELFCALALFLGLALAFSLMFAPLAQATGGTAIGSQDGLRATIATDKDVYSTGDDIQIDISATNTNHFMINDVALAGVLPGGLKLKSGVLTKEIANLEPGATLSVSAVAVAQSPGGSGGSPVSEDTTNTNTSHDTSSVVKLDTNAKGGLPSAGDAADILLPIVFVLIFWVGLTVATQFREKIQKAVSIFLCIALIVAMIPVLSYASTTPTPKSFNLTKAIKADGKDYSIGARVSYTLESDKEPQPIDDSSYTRGQWLQLLEEKLDIVQVSIDDGYDYAYGDSPDSQYGAVVETAQVYDLLSTPATMSADGQTAIVPLFEPNEPATREFVAYTVVKAMGYIGDYTLDCSDARNLLYESEDSIAVQEDFLALEDGAFLPDNPITTVDKNVIFAKIDELNASFVIAPGEEKDDITYQDGVVQVSDTNYTAADNGDGTYTVSLSAIGPASEITPGVVFVLSPSDTYPAGIALKVISASVQGGIITLSCVKPDISQVMSDFDFAGNGIADIEHIELADGVTAEYDPNGAIASDDNTQISPFSIAAGGSVALPGKLKINLAEAKIGDSDITASGDLELSIPDITVKAKGKVSWGGPSLTELTVSETTKAKLKGSVKYDLGVPDGSFDAKTEKATFGQGKMQILRIPFDTVTGVPIDLVVFLNFEIGGKITVSYTITNTSGFQYRQGHAFRVIESAKSAPPGLDLNASAKLGVGLDAQVSFDLFGFHFDLAGTNLQGGFGVTAKHALHPDTEPPLWCGDGSFYLYASLGLDKDTLIGGILKDVRGIVWSWDIFDEENSPCKANIHLENGKVVPKCTYGSGSLLGTVEDVQTKEAIGGAKVRIYNDETGVLVETVSTKKALTVTSGLQLGIGQFEADLPAATYRIEVAATGYPQGAVTAKVAKDKQATCEIELGIVQSGEGGNDESGGDGSIDSTVAFISRAYDGGFPNQDVVNPSVSADGQRVVFESTATNLAPDDTNGYSDIFLYDNSTKAITRISVGVDGAQSNGDSNYAKISGNGRYVLFQSVASNLVSGDTNGGGDVFRYDIATGALELADTKNDGSIRGLGVRGYYSYSDGTSYGDRVSDISSDGRYVVFVVWSPDDVGYGGYEIPSGQLIVRHDMSTGQNELVNTVSTETNRGINRSSYSPHISSDGRYVVYSEAVGAILDMTDRLYVRDMSSFQLPVPITPALRLAYIDICGISDDGSRVLFASPLSTLASGDGNGVKDVFLWDVTPNTITLISATPAGTSGNSESDQASMSCDGRFIVFASHASDLIAGDTNGCGDVFRYDTTTKMIERVVTFPSKYYTPVWTPVLSGDGKTLVFQADPNAFLGENPAVGHNGIFLVGLSTGSGD